jgi:hypothetical protein
MFGPPNMPYSARARQEVGLGEWLGVLIAIVSSCLGGTAAAVTRYLVGSADPLTLAILRWSIGFLCVLPTALLLRVRWPLRRAGRGLCRHLDRYHRGRKGRVSRFRSSQTLAAPLMRPPVLSNTLQGHGMME